MIDKIVVDQIFEKYLKSHHDEYRSDYRTNAIELIKRVNPFLNEVIELIPAHSFFTVVSSGWRPPSINVKTPGSAKNSLHIQGKAIDIADPNGFLKKTILANSHLLKKYNLWMEDPEMTPTWIHLDIGIRSNRAVNIFYTKV